MNTETFARRMTGSESLNDDQKKQIREQQEVCWWQFVIIIQSSIVARHAMQAFVNIL